MNPILNWFLGLLRPKTWNSAYENASFSTRRGQVPGAAPTDAKRELTPFTRRELIRRSRYLAKNSGFTREVVADMAIYSIGDGIKPQAQSSNPEWNRKAESYFARWAALCDITNRFSFAECQTLVCRGIDIDGEYFVVKVRDGLGRPRLQLLESHRIGHGGKAAETEDGVIIDAYGVPVAYRVLLDNGFRDVPADRVMHIFEPEWASALRNAPTLQHSINHLLDEMELLALEKIAVKDNADVSRVIKTESGEIDETGDFSIRTNSGSTEPSDPKAIQQIVGGKVVTLKPGESMDTHTSSRPSPVFTGFLESLKRDSAAGVLPYEFVLDPSKVGGASVRLIVAKADRRFSFRQLILIQRLLTPTWAWVIGDAIEQGALEFIEGWGTVAFTTPRRLSVDAGREAQQNRSDVETGLRTLSDHYAELGMDFEHELLRRAKDARMILDVAAKYGLPTDMLWRPSGTQSVVSVDSAPAKE
jgi:lambda family phage portal protein